MPARPNIRTVLTVTALAAATLQLTPAAAPPPGHSNHGEAFNEGPRQSARLIDGVDQIISFPVTTSHPKAQRFINQGICQLHGFWYFEAERSFRQAAMLDPDCAMAYWGMALANLRNTERAKGFLKKAVDLKENVTEREKLWITVLENQFPDKEEDKRSREQKARELIRDIEAVSIAHPNDIEAKAFLAWAMWAKKSDVPISSYQAVNALLDQVFAIQPLHPAHHYRIHLWDQKKPDQALESAAMTGQSAPGIAHLWHMPGHIYSKLKHLDDAVWHQEASSRVDHRHMNRYLILPYQIHNYAHNEEWLVRSYNEVGRVADGIALAKSLINIPRHPKANALDKSGSCASYGRTRLIDLLTTWELWDKLVHHSKTAWLEPTVQEGHQIKRHHALALAHYHRNEPNKLAAQVEALETLKKKAEEKKKKPEPKEEDSKESPANKPDSVEDTENPKPKPKPKNPRPSPLLKALAEAKALQKVLANDPDAGDSLKAAASKIPPQRLATYWLDLDDTEAANALMEKLPQTINGDLLRAELELLAEKTQDSRRTFERLRKSAAHIDDDLPATERLLSLAEFFDLKDKWRQPAPPSEAAASRPDQSAFGPLRWIPPTAPAWQGLTLDGSRLTSETFENGKPTLALFYLGNKCIHCMEQVVAVAEAADKFEKAGINIVAVSADTLEELPGALDKSPTPGSLPFPILADPKMTSFKNFRAYDDFESTPLHALALIDSDGKLRWLDTGYEPFTEVDFLLKECKRLLAL